MRHRAVIAGCCLSLGVGLSMPGCAAFRLRRPRETETPAAATVRKELDQAATAAMDRGDLDMARADLERLVAQTPRSAEFHYRLGKVRQLLTDYQGAQASFLQALEIDSQYVGALIGLGQIDFRFQRYEAALHRYDMAIEYEVGSPDAHLARGQALEMLGRVDDALSAYFRAIELQPGSSQAMTRIATLQLGQGKPEQALVRFEKANGLTPNDPDIRYGRGMALLASKKSPSLAVDDLKFAASRRPDRPDIFLALAQALEADRKPDQAREAVDQALRLQPNDPIARDLSARLRR